MEHLGILTASPPGENGVGQNYMRDVADAIQDREKSVFALLKQESEWDDDARMGWKHTLTLPRRFEYPKMVGGRRIGQLTANLGFEWMTRRHAEKLSRLVVGDMEAKDVGRLLVVLESPLLILLADALAKTNRSFPMHVIVWDHPEHVASSFGHTGWRKRRLLGAFSRVIERAVSGITVAPAMRRWLADLDSETPFVLYRSPVEVVTPQARSESSADEFVIGFAGSVTAPDELEQLQRALDSMQWHCAGRKIILRLFGKRYTLSSDTSRRVEYRGFMPTRSDVVEELAACDLTFLPQPFSDSKRFVAEYSFPTKLSSYLAAGTPCLVLAPAYASLSKYRSSEGANESEVGFQMVDGNPEMIAALIRRIVSDSEYLCRGRQRALACAGRAFNRVQGAQRIMSALER